MLTAVGLAVSVGIGRSGNDQGKQKPGAAEKDCKGKKKTSKVETWRWTKCSSKRGSQMDSACKREDTEFLHWHILRSATGILFSQQVAN